MLFCDLIPPLRTDVLCEWSLPKLIINGYEVYYLMSDNFAPAEESAAAAAYDNAANETLFSAVSVEGSGASDAEASYDDAEYMELGSGDFDGSGSGQVPFHSSCLLNKL